MKGRIDKIAEAASVLCVEIEKLPASEQQTKISLLASEIRSNLFQMAAPIAEISGKVPIVLYFDNDADANEFSRLIQQVKPMVLRRLA
jgi:hypothetical protein